MSDVKNNTQTDTIDTLISNHTLLWVVSASTFLRRTITEKEKERDCVCVCVCVCVRERERERERER